MELLTELRLRMYIRSSARFRSLNLRTLTVVRSLNIRGWPLSAPTYIGCDIETEAKH